MKMGTPLLFAAVALFAGCSAEDQTVPQLIETYRAAMTKGDYATAGMAAEELIKHRPAFGYRARGFVRSAEGKYTDAVADMTRSLELDPQQPDTFRWRGRDLFKLGKFDEAIADFDRLAKARPDTESGLWERGLAYYYAGRFLDGVKQFTAYATVDNRDIENGLWHYLCTAKIEGAEPARKSILAYEQKRESPFPELLALYSGKGSAEVVLKAAEDGIKDRNRLRVNRFFAHYYLGKHFDAIGKPEEAMAHMKLAVGNEISVKEFASGNFMWHCARIDLERLEKQAKLK
jgi:lipoprotein NlpI